MEKIILIAVTAFLCTVVNTDQTTCKSEPETKTEVSSRKK